LLAPRRRCRNRSVFGDRSTEQVREARLLPARRQRELGREGRLSLGEAPEHGVHLLQRLERMESRGAGTELPGRLRPPQEEHREYGQRGLVEFEPAVEGVSVLL